jgi:1-deoxy-D-xylulose-5-phosphate reductoisomerase
VKRLAILGSTGSIGRSALAVVDAHPDRLKVVALAAGDNAPLLAEQVRRYAPDVVAMASSEGVDRLRAACGADVRVTMTGGAGGLVAVATHPSVDIVICASSGTAGLEAVLAAIAAGKRIALANKEILVMAGALVTKAARAHGVPLLPVDSEHNAIHKCLHGRQPAEVARLILTASGGPFRTWPAAKLEHATPEDALRHPTWQMGRKITIDSATLMNKGLELIEAYHLFPVEADQLEVVVHPQSIIHALVAFRDGSMLAQLASPDMRTPIALSLTWPSRMATPTKRIDLVELGQLSFERPDEERFMALALGRQVLKRGGMAPAVLNAANEVAVDAFLDGRLGFLQIAQLVAKTLDVAEGRGLLGVATDVGAIIAVDAAARQLALNLLGTGPGTDVGSR